MTITRRWSHSQATGVQNSFTTYCLMDEPVVDGYGPNVVRVLLDRQWCERSYR